MIALIARRQCFVGSRDVPGRMDLVTGQIMNFGCPF
eukprot:COSAG01_NODE_440_length_17033_cov_16.301110_1_plen_35_part_10